MLRSQRGDPGFDSRPVHMPMQSKKGTHVLQSAEHALCDWLVPLLPVWLETYHLTLLTIVWSAMAIYTGYLSANNKDWLWLLNGLILLQYLTDVLDGEVGRRRKTGLIRWGYYMDHFLDCVFMASLFGSYLFISESRTTVWLLIVLVEWFMVSSFLEFGATSEFVIYFNRIGPTEARLALLALNTFFWWSGDVRVFDVLSIALAVGLCWIVWQTQKKLWKQDTR